MRLGILAYPWDLADEGPAQAVACIAERLGCNALALNANYHTARLLRPRAHGPKMLDRPAALAAFQPDPARYATADLNPAVDADLVRHNVLAEAAAACAAHGVDFGLWVVGLHNSTLGAAHPDLCMRNCFGDVYTYALCPTQPRVRGYASDLVADVCAQFGPHRVILEAVGWLGLRHGVHHELVMTAWDEALELLTGLCFCPACLDACARAGLDAVRLQVRVRTWAEQLLNEERGALPLSFRHAEPAALLLAIPGLADFLGWRATQVTRLVAEAAEAAHRYDAALEVIPASFHRPSSRAWLEGADLAGLARVADGLVILAYSADPAEVGADLQWAAACAPDRLLIAGLNACAPCDSASGLAAQATAARDAGATAIYYYNYGMLTERRLAWLATANRA